MDDKLTQFLIFLAIAIGSAIFNWLKKKGHDDLDEEGLPPQAMPPRKPPAQPPKVPAPPQNFPSTLQEQVRRILEERARQALPPAPRQPPPAPPKRVAPPTVPPVARAPKKPPIVTRVEEEERGIAVHLQGLRESARAYEQAKGLDRKVGAQLAEVKKRIEAHPAVKVLSHAGPETAYARSLLRNPQTLRATVIASVVLGPPKAEQ